MTPDILASLQTYADTQAFPQAGTSTSPENADSQPGMFSALMEEYASVSEDTEILEQALFPAVSEAEEQVTAFTANNSFARSVIDILAGVNNADDDVPDTEEVQPLSQENADEAVIWPEDDPVTETEPHHSALGRNVSEIIGRLKDYLSGKAQYADLTETDLQEAAEQVIREERVNDIPEELRGEIGHVVNEIASALKKEDGKDTQPVVRLLAAVAERIAPGVQEDTDETQDASDDSDVTPETLEAVAELAGLAVVPNAPQPVQDVSVQETPPENPGSQVQRRQQPETRHIRPAQTESQTQSQEQQETPEVQTGTSKFREVQEDRNAQQDDSGRDQQDTQSQDQPQGQGRNDSGTGNTSSRSRTETRRVDTRTQIDGTEPTSGTSARRTESRSDFSAYFEGVLTSRRTASRTPSAPLDLRSTEDFTHATALRDGLTNIVRFIRADGVQKARVVVDPPELGRISVELTSGTSGVEASIKVASEQIRQLVQDQLSQLRMNLSQQGVQVAEFTVDVQQDSSGQHNPQGQGQNGQYMNFFNDEADEETEEFRIDLEDGLLYWVA